MLFYSPFTRFFSFFCFLIYFPPFLRSPASPSLHPPTLTWVSFYSFHSSPLTSLYQSVGCAFVWFTGSNQIHSGIESRVAMASCIWKPIHSAVTLQFNLKQDWCWQTSHTRSSKMFPPLPTSIADGQRACATLCWWFLGFSAQITRTEGRRT